MSRFIEEFYYGNIDPQARSTKENKAVQKQMEILMNNEDLLPDLVDTYLILFPSASIGMIRLIKIGLFS